MAIVLQLSDPHLLAEPNARLRGVPTRQTLADVLALALARHPTIDRLVLTGDLAHDEAPATYQALRALLGPHAARSHPLPGNHDDRTALRSAFPELAGSAEAAVRFAEIVDGWCLVGLDSRIPGEDAGRVGPEQLAWLRETLAAHASVPTVIFVHHPPVPTGHPWLDGMGLLDADALATVLADAPWVRALCHGHIHRDFEARLGAVPVLGAPSTAFQFPAHPDHGAYDLRPPGARVLCLTGESLRTEVLRLPRLEHPPIEREAAASA
jgi:3',5'-cyclic-AMP phosphodiesterase